MRFRNISSVAVVCGSEYPFLSLIFKMLLVFVNHLAVFKNAVMSCKNRVSKMVI